MNTHNLTEHVGWLFGMALNKTNRIDEAEDLVQETFLAAIGALEKGTEIENPKRFLSAILNKKFYDRLRQKYRMPTVSINMISEPIQEDTISEEIEKSEEAAEIRKCLASLTKLYREILVRFYMRGEKISQIATSLGIPENTVKSRLKIGREKIKEEFTMENYTTQSYAPEHLSFWMSGRHGMKGEPSTLVQGDKIAMNLLILAYKEPVTISELSKAIGISTAYIEPVIEKLVDGELMKKTADKVYTDFIIFSKSDVEQNFSRIKELTEKICNGVWESMEEGLSELRAQDFYTSLGKSKALKLESFFVLRTMVWAVEGIKNEVAGYIPFEDFPDRPNGGKWYAMGYNFPSFNDFAKSNFCTYNISGEASNGLDDYAGLSKIELHIFDCLLGKTNPHEADLPFPMDSIDVMKMLYAIHTDNERDLSIIDMHIFDNIDGFVKMNFLRRDKNGKLLCDVPVLKIDELEFLCRLTEKYNKIIAEKFHDEIMSLMKNPVKTPPHLKSVPNFLRYLPCAEGFSMQLILKAHEEGLFLPGIDLEKNPVPAVVLAVCE